MLQVIKKLEALNRLNEIADKFTELNDEKFIEHGVLFFIPLERYEVKVLSPAPFHKKLIASGNPTYKQVLTHKEAMLLK